jgi:uncharacterized protein
MDIASVLCEEFALQAFQIQNTLAMFDEGATVPFISRYRKERTGSLDEIQLRDIEHKYAYYKELNERREVILESIKEQGKLSAELEQKIRATRSKTEIEDLYLPFKPKRTTRATKARDAGLEPLARWLVELEDGAQDPEHKALEFVNAEKGYESALKALRGAGDILAEELAENAEVRKWLRERALESGTLVSVVRKEFEGQKTKFEMYYDFRELVKDLPSHRILAMLRGEKEKVLRVSLEIEEVQALSYLERTLICHAQSGAVPFLREVVKDSLDRLLMIATETEVRKELRERADEAAFAVFADNLRNLLLSAPAGQKPVLAIDPGFRTGCKVVVLDATGKFMQYQTIYPNAPQNRTAEASRTITDMITTHGVELIAIGNGTASRESERFARDTIALLPEQNRPICIIVNESGASVYSASEVAIREFPDEDVTVRGAISIGRRLQDPLSELVKIDPKSIGVGQYQHDVNQSKLKERLEEVVESCVNTVGVNVNLASEELLKYVSGLNRIVARNVVEYRNQHGAFASRDELMKVSGLGAKTFEQAAGFLRIPDATNPLDNSSVHPERYSLVQRMVERLERGVRDIIGNVKLIRTIDKKEFVSDEVGLPTIEDIVAELEKPGRDPRSSFDYAHFSETVQEIKDLQEGMRLEGTVTNVTNFGAFVDIGVHQDGLVHISELSDKFVDDPLKVVKVGQVVKVTVTKVDAQMKRIALSMKSEPGVRPTKKPGGETASQSGAPRTSAASHAKGKGSGGAGEKALKTVKPKFSIRQIMK